MLTCHASAPLIQAGCSTSGSQSCDRDILWIGQRAAEELLSGSGTVFKRVDAYDHPMPMCKENLLPGLPTGQERTHAQVTAGARRLTSRRVGAVSMFWMPGSRLMRWSM